MLKNQFQGHYVFLYDRFDNMVQGKATFFLWIQCNLLITEYKETWMADKNTIESDVN